MFKRMEKYKKKILAVGIAKICKKILTMVFLRHADGAKKYWIGLIGCATCANFCKHERINQCGLITLEI